MSKIFGDNLKTYRLMAKMTQLDLANSVGVTRNAIANYEVGRSEPNFETMCLLSAALGVDLNDLVRKHTPGGEPTIRFQITEEEHGLIQAYREADPIYKGIALDILRTHKA